MEAGTTVRLRLEGLQMINLAADLAAARGAFDCSDDRFQISPQVLGKAWQMRRGRMIRIVARIGVPFLFCTASRNANAIRDKYPKVSIDGRETVKAFCCLADRRSGRLHMRMRCLSAHRAGEALVSRVLSSAPRKNLLGEENRCRLELELRSGIPIFSCGLIGIYKRH